MTGYTGRAVTVRVTHIVAGGEYGVPAGMCVMSIGVVSWIPVEPVFGCVARDIKTDPAPFQAVWDGDKRCEVRSTADRTFRVGDVLLLREYVREGGGR